MLTVESLVIAINKTRYQFAILVKRYFLIFFYNRRFITGIFKKRIWRETLQNFAIFNIWLHS